MLQFQIEKLFVAVVNKLKQMGRYCRVWGSHSNGYEDPYLLGYIIM
jgi:hypothetical protein